LFAGGLLLGKGIHFVSFITWGLVRILETHDAHGGYEFSWSPFRLVPLSTSATYHYYHHSHNIGNYSTFFTIWDTVFGSNKAYYKYIAECEEKSKTE
jgi:sterol desaturase/sphingolipid hydroxylase (fatty acid hydroxylase superfamily)